MGSRELETIGPDPRAWASQAYGQGTRTYIRRTGDRLLILAAQDATPLVLRGTAMDIWDAFASPRSVSEAARELAARYGAPLADVHAEVQTVVDVLSTHGMLTALGGRER